MTRTALAVLLLVLLAGGPASLPVRAQSDSTTLAQQAPLRRYLDDVLAPSVRGAPPPDAVLRGFYAAGLSDRTRAAVGEEEFVAFWRQLGEGPRALFVPTLTNVTLTQPAESQDRTQALILATMRFWSLFSITVAGVPGLVLVGCLQGLDPRVEAVPWCTRDSRAPLSDGYGRANALYRVVKEGDDWKLVLHDGLVAEMQRLTPQITARRYAVRASAADGGLTFMVTAVELRREDVRVQLTVTNAGDAAARIVNALSLSELVDETGAVRGTRLLRSEIPEVVPARSFAQALVSYEPIPPTAQSATLVIPELREGDPAFRLRLPVVFRSLPFAARPLAPIPAEPVLLFLAATLRMPPTDDVSMALYRRTLATESRSQVSAKAFAEYYRSGAVEGLLCRLGFPYEFTLGPAPASAGPERIEFRMVGTGGLPSGPDFRPGRGITLQTVREGTEWRLALPADLIGEMRQARAGFRNHLIYAAADVREIEVIVENVWLDSLETTLGLRILNRSRGDVRLEDVRNDTYLVDRFGTRYEVDPKTLSVQLQPGTSVRVRPRFAPLPVESHWLSLTVGTFKGDRVPGTIDREIRLNCP